MVGTVCSLMRYDGRLKTSLKLLKIVSEAEWPDSTKRRNIYGMSQKVDFSIIPLPNLKFKKILSYSLSYSQSRYLKFHQLQSLFLTQFHHLNPSYRKKQPKNDLLSNGVILQPTPFPPQIPPQLIIYRPS